MLSGGIRNWAGQILRGMEADDVATMLTIGLAAMRGRVVALWRMGGLPASAPQPRTIGCSATALMEVQKGGCGAIDGRGGARPTRTTPT